MENKATRHGIIKLAWPLILASASDVIMTTVDTIFVGHLGTVQIAAVGLSGIFIWATYNLFKGNMFCVGTFTAQNFGAKRYRYSVIALYNGLFVALIAALIIFAYRSTVPFLVGLMKPSLDVQNAATVYIQIRLLGAIGFFSAIAFASFFRGTGRTKTIFKVSLFANLLNIILDYILIFVFEMGIAGAAIATVISQLTSALTYLMVFVFGKQKEFDLSMKIPKIDFEELYKLLKIGVPLSFKIFSEVFVVFLFNVAVGRLGNAQLAATAIMLQIMVIANMTALGFGQAGEIMVGQFIGAKRHDEAFLAGKYAIETNTLVTFGFIAVLLLAPAQICSIFNSDPAVISYFRMIALFGAVFICFDCLQLVAGICLEGAGDTKIQFYYMLIFGYVVYLPLAYFLTFVMSWDIYGAWLATAIYMLLFGTLIYHRFKSGAWRKIVLVKTT